MVEWYLIGSARVSLAAQVEPSTSVSCNFQTAPEPLERAMIFVRAWPNGKQYALSGCRVVIASLDCRYIGSATRSADDRR